MKYRVTDIVMLLLSVTLLFCGCAPASAAEAAAVLTEPPFHTESEALYHPDQTTLRQNMEWVYDGSGTLTQETRTQYDRAGNLTCLTVTEFDETGAAAAYEETHYDSGSLSSTLVKNYEMGILRRQVEIHYFPNGDARIVEESVYSAAGTLQKWHQRSYNEAGERLSDMRDQLDPETGLITVSGEARYENGSLKTRRSGIRHGGDSSLLDGRIENFDESGNLIRLEEAVWIEESRSGILAVTEYDASGNVLFSRQALQYRDGQGRITTLDETLYEQNMVFASHRVENRSYDSTGQNDRREIRYFLSDGTASEQYEYRYEYDGSSRLLREEKRHRLNPEGPQNLTVTEYAYHEDGALRSETQTGFDEDLIQTFQTVKTYDAFGKIAEFVTVSNLSNRYTYSYTYDEEGVVLSELMTTQYRSGTRIDYRETAWEYHGNGKYKTVTVHTWTSHDEAKYPDAAPGDLGKTTVTAYDEDGNRIEA